MLNKKDLILNFNIVQIQSKVLSGEPKVIIQLKNKL